MKESEFIVIPKKEGVTECGKHMKTRLKSMLMKHSLD